MKKSFLKKSILSSILLMSVFSTVALASGDSCSFSFNGKKGYGNLHCSWSTDQADSGWADTSHPGVSGYSVTTYIESTKNGEVKATDFKVGSTYARTRTLNQNTTRFNSTHGIASSSNVYVAAASAQCTDW